MKELPQFIKESWIGKFIEYSQPFPTPEIFKRWAAISGVMGGLERRVWIDAAGTTAYPSHYILLVAPPGVGKSRVIKEIESIWLQTGLLKVAPQSATKAAMVDALKAAQRNFKLGNETIFFHSLQIAATEFGVLIPQYDMEAMNFYNLLWDCEAIFREHRRHGEPKEISIDYPQINMLAGTQPAYLGALLPNDAFGMGFTARLVMVYCDIPARPKLFGAVTKVSEEVKKELIKDMKRICDLSGEMKYTPEAEEFLESWYERNDDEPEHPKLQAYNVRRIVTIQKVGMAISAACSSDMIVGKHHLEFALDSMHHAEAYMPEIFKGMQVPETSNVMGELWNFLRTMYMKTGKKPVGEHMLTNFLKGRVEIHKIDSIMKHMLSTKLMEEAPTQNLQNGKWVTQGKCFIPLDNNIQY